MTRFYRRMVFDGNQRVARFMAWCAALQRLTRPRRRTGARRHEVGGALRNNGTIQWEQLPQATSFRT